MRKKRERGHRKKSLDYYAIVSVYLPPEYIEYLDALVDMGIFDNRSEIVEAALEELLRKYDVRIEDEDIDALRGR